MGFLVFSLVVAATVALAKPEDYSTLEIFNTTSDIPKKPEVESVTSPSKIHSFYEECNRQTVSETILSTNIFDPDTKTIVTSVLIHPNIALISKKGLSPGKGFINVGNEWRPLEDVQSASGSAFHALLWTKKITKKIPICIPDDGIVLGDCHAEFWEISKGWPDEDLIYKNWDGFKIIRGEECNGGTTICVKECLPNNAAVFCQAPGQFKVFVGFAVNCNKGKTRLADVTDVRRWLHELKDFVSEE